MLVKRNMFDLVIEVISIVCMIAVVVFLVVHWDSFPDSIPGHYNALGKIDKITDKNSLIGLQAVAWILYMTLTVVGFFPQIWNTGVKITEANKEMVYPLLKHMIVILKLIVVFIFSYLTLHSTTGKNLPSLFLPIMLIATFGNLGYWTIRLYITNQTLKNK